MSVDDLEIMVEIRNRNDRRLLMKGQIMVFLYVPQYLQWGPETFLDEYH